jgi:uncharacterized protein YaeQ
MLSDDQFQMYLNEWDADRNEEGAVNLTLYEEPPSTTQAWMERQYYVIYNNKRIDLTTGQAARLHYWFELQRQRFAPKMVHPTFSF